MSENKVQVKQITRAEDIPAPEPRTFGFRQNGQAFSMEFWPLSAEEVEAIRASVPEPVAPDKPLPGKTTKELATLKDQGFPTTYKDVNDPVYQAAVGRRQDDLSLEMVRVALRWGLLPGTAEADSLREARETFQKEMRRRLTAGNYQNLLNEVTRHTFTLDGNLIDRFFENSAPQTRTDVDS